MSVKVVTPPSTGLVSLDEAKKHVRFSAADDDGYMEGLIAAVSSYLDDPDGPLGRALSVQSLEEDRMHFPGPVWAIWDGLPHWCRHEHHFIVRCPPIIEITSLSYVDDSGTVQQIDPSMLIFDDRRFQLAPNTPWPIARHQIGAVKVQYQAGYAELPQRITQAALLMIGSLYANREATPETAFCGAVTSLLSSYLRVV